MPKRKYQAPNTQGTYRFNARTDVGGTTRCRTHNSNARTPQRPHHQTFCSIRIQAGVLELSEGDLQIDQRHRARIWADYGLPKLEGMTVSVLQTLETGTPYGASNINNTAPTASTRNST